MTFSNIVSCRKSKKLCASKHFFVSQSLWYNDLTPVFSQGNSPNYFLVLHLSLLSHFKWHTATLSNHITELLIFLLPNFLCLCIHFLSQVQLVDCLWLFYFLPNIANINIWGSSYWKNRMSSYFLLRFCI